ncbi:MAG: FAD-dependent oxidoreductase [Coriobacteriales bacterium]|jgi:NADPH-dependent 2,4-dienoyl-CoA reductase/sulfur reductase-like enzyme/rhodanese-related sulfurtransferase|nr:FAD-dependent oxidoreductase [Coriobacteriales bacterium]
MGKTVIVGGVAGGATAAARLRRLDESAEIVIFERGGYVSFANCGLPYHIGGVIAQRDRLLLQTVEGFDARYRVDVRLRSEVRGINRTQRTVSVTELETGREYEESYDSLILSPGARPQVPPADADATERIFTLHTIADMDDILSFVAENRPTRAVVMGGGFVGIEAAENLVKAGLKVTLIQRSAQVLPPLDPEMATWVHTELRENGVRLLLESPVGGTRQKDDGLAIELTHGKTIETDFLVAAIGVRPVHELAVAAGLTVGERGGIVTDEHMRTSDPNIYAVGDAVEVKEFVSHTKSLIALAGPANKQGRIAADNICGIPSVYKGTQGSAVIKVFGVTAAMTGINEKTAKRLALDFDKIYFFASNHAGYYPDARDMVVKVIFENGSGRILGGQIIGYEGTDKRCDVLAMAIRAGMTAFDLTELELCYAPPYSSAKDPINIAGYMIENLLTGKSHQFHWHDIDSLPRDGSATLLDVRFPHEYVRDHIDGFVNIPVDELRARIDEIEPGKPVCLICHIGLRSYIASRILAQHGFSVSHLCGGYRFYQSIC